MAEVVICAMCSVICPAKIPPLMGGAPETWKLSMVVPEVLDETVLVDAAKDFRDINVEACG